MFHTYDFSITNENIINTNFFNIYIIILITEREGVGEKIMFFFLFITAKEIKCNIGNFKYERHFVMKRT